MAIGGISSAYGGVQSSLNNKIASLEGKLVGNLGMTDLNGEDSQGIGISVSGANEYLQNIKTNGIDRAITALNDTDTFTNVFRQYWQGRAEANFEQNTYLAIKTITSQLQTIKEQIESQISDMIETWALQDEELVKVDSDIISNIGEEV